MRLTAPDDLLETGIELEAKPSGKNVKKLSLLSGGERSLTALAYLFAVVLKGTRYISVASIVAAVSFPVTYVLIALVCGWPVLGEQLPLLVFSVLVAAMIVYKHLPAGKHTLTVFLANNDHSPVGAKATIHFKVR